MGADMSTPSAPGARSASQRAYEFAKWAILSAVYPPGAVITEAGLGHTVGMASRALLTPLS